MLICMRVHHSVSGCKLHDTKTDAIHIARIAPWLPGGKGADVAVCCMTWSPWGGGLLRPAGGGGAGGAQLRPPQQGTQGDQYLLQRTVQCQWSLVSLWSSWPPRGSGTCAGAALRRRAGGALSLSPRSSAMPCCSTCWRFY